MQAELLSWKFLDSKTIELYLWSDRDISCVLDVAHPDVSKILELQGMSMIGSKVNLAINEDGPITFEGFIDA